MIQMSYFDGSMGTGAWGRELGNDTVGTAPWKRHRGKRTVGMALWERQQFFYYLFQKNFTSYDLNDLY